MDTPPTLSPDDHTLTIKLTFNESALMSSPDVHKYIQFVISEGQQRLLDLANDMGLVPVHSTMTLHDISSDFVDNMPIGYISMDVEKIKDQS